MAQGWGFRRGEPMRIRMPHAGATRGPGLRLKRAGLRTSGGAETKRPAFPEKNGNH